jgi:NAD-dependent dihydropyrimidine dehydrogenase PreA subunit
MGKTLKVIFPDKCIGCELCVMEAQRQLGKLGFEGALIRVLRDESELGIPVLRIDIDPSISEIDMEKIEKICPMGVFVVEEVIEEGHGLTD